MLAIVFPGQGSQEVGMAMDFVRHSPLARSVLQEADDATELPLSRWIEEGPDEVLQRTEITQPAILAASIAIYRVLEPQLPAQPAYFAGHSLGEYTALVAAGALELADAVRLVRRRGALMQEAVPQGAGAMTAVIGLESDEVARICSGVDGVVSAANFNSPRQTVVAGERRAVQEACAAFEGAGAKKLVPLAVSAPFHCALMESAMEKFAPVLAETGFREARVPVLSNVTAAPYQGAHDAPVLLRDQVCAPVRWVECVRRLVDSGVRIQLEIGPGKVLTGLAARIERRLARANVAKLDDLDGALAQVREALA
jgi:[acyl-carrier-protein] S-malonyltransferase